MTYTQLGLIIFTMCAMSPNKKVHAWGGFWLLVSILGGASSILLGR